MSSQMRNGTFHERSEVLKNGSAFVCGRIRAASLQLVRAYYRAYGGYAENKLVDLSGTGCKRRSGTRADADGRCQSAG